MAIKIGDAFISIGGDASQLKKAFNDLGKKVALAMTAVAATITVGLGNALREAANFRDKLQNINALGVEDIGSLERAVEDVAIAFGVNLTEAVEQTYQLISAGIDEAPALEALSLAAMAAKTNVGSLSDAMDLGTSVLNAWGLNLNDGSEAMAALAHIYGAFTAAVTVGKTTFEDMGSSVGQVTALAAEAGVGIEEFAGAIAALTLTGGTSAEQITKLKAIISNVTKVTPEARQAAKSLGFEFEATALKTKGLRDFMVDVTQGIKDGIPGFNEERWQLERRKMILEGNLEAGQEFADELKRSTLELGITSQSLEKDTQEHDANIEAKNKNRRASLEHNIATRAMGKELGEVNGKLAELGDTSGDYTSQLGRLFESKQAISAILSLTGSQLETWDEAIRQASRGVDNLTEGYQRFRENNPLEDWRQLVAVKQVLAKTIGDALLPALSTFSKRGTEIGIRLLEWIRNNRELTATIAKVTGVVGIIFGVLGPLILLIPFIIASIGSLATIFGVLLGPIGLVIAAVMTFIGAIALWIDETVGLVNIYNSLVEQMRGWFSAFANFFTGIRETLADSGISERFVEFKEQLAELTRSIVDRLLQFGQKVLEVFQSVVVPALIKGWEAVLSFTQEFVVPALEQAFEQIEGVLTTLGEMFSRIFQWVSETVEDNWEQITRIFKISAEIVGLIVQMFIDFMSMLFTAITAIMQGIGLAFENQWSSVGDSTKSGVEMTLTLIEGFLSGIKIFFMIAVAVFGVFRKAWEIGWPILMGIVSVAVKAILFSFTFLADQMMLPFKAFVAVLDWVGLSWEKFVNFIDQGIKFILKGLGTMFQAFGGLLGFEAGGVVPGLASGGLAKGGLVMVGEQGPELAALPKKTRVFSHQDSQAMLNEAMQTGGSGGKSTVVEKIVLFENAIIRETADLNELMDKAGQELRRVLSLDGGNVAGGIV